MSMVFIPVELDKPRKIVFGWGALKLFKKNYGKSLFKVDFDNEDIDDIVPLVFYCGLVHEDPELTVERVTQLIDENLGLKGSLEIMEKIMAELEGDSDTKNGATAAKKKK
jgi:hypothetical protein